MEHKKASTMKGRNRHFSGLRDRHIWNAYHISASDSSANEKLALARLKVGPAAVKDEEEFIVVSFDNPNLLGSSSHQFRYLLPEMFEGDGVGVRVRLRNWKKIDYIAVGFTDGTVYRHVKATHPLLDDWFDLSVGFQDLAWGWRNNWETLATSTLSDVRFYIKGIPGAKAACDVSDVWVWQECDSPDALFGEEAPIPQSLIDNIFQYQRDYFPDYKKQSRQFLKNGLCPLAGGVMLEWPISSALPPNLNDNGTFQYSWHSLHSAVLLMLHAVDSKRDRMAAISATRDLVSTWLSTSFDQPDPNIKYAWYDHGVAERLLALIMLYSFGQKYRFDARYMKRLRHAIWRHGQFLESDVFYAGHQPSRYHNHAWFQDLALMAAGMAFPNWKCSDYWIERALYRITDQFEKLIVPDGSFAVFAENSTGYHFGIQRLVANIATFSELSCRDTGIPELVDGLRRFSDLMRFPCGKRAPGQGDTFRLPNTEKGDHRGKKAFAEDTIACLPKAGYAVAKGNHGKSGASLTPYAIYVFASCRTSTHKHADNLSFSLYFDGIEWLIDPSFLSHEYSSPIPNYLRGPVAHNAFVISDEPYSIEPGKARISGDADRYLYTFEGRHTAIEGLEFNRKISGSTKSVSLSFSDWIVPANDPRVEKARLMLHCGEHVDVTILDRTAILTHPASLFSLQIDLSKTQDIVVINGREEEPVRGVAGTTFLNHSVINTIEATPITPGQIKWSIQAKKR